MLRTLKNIAPQSLISDRASRQRELVTAMRGGSNYSPRFPTELRLADYPHIQSVAHSQQS